MPITINTKRTVAPTVNQSPFNSGSAPLGAFGGYTARAQIRAAEELGRAVEQGSEVMLHIEEQENLTAAQEMELEFSSFIKETLMGDGTPENLGYLSTQGYNAVDNQLNTNMAIEQFAASKIEGSENARIAKLFGDASVARIDAASNQINYHAVGQRTAAVAAMNEAYREEAITYMTDNLYTLDGIANLDLWQSTMDTSDTVLATIGANAGEHHLVTENAQVEGRSEISFMFAMNIALSGYDEDRQERIDLAKRFLSLKAASFTPADLALARNELDQILRLHLNDERIAQTLADDQKVRYQEENFISLIGRAAAGEDVTADAQQMADEGGLNSSQLMKFTGNLTGNEDLYWRLQSEIINLEPTNTEELNDIRDQIEESTMTQKEIAGVYSLLIQKEKEENINISGDLYKLLNTQISNILSGTAPGSQGDTSVRVTKVQLEFYNLVSDIDGQNKDAVQAAYNSLMELATPIDSVHLTRDKLPDGMPTSFDPSTLMGRDPVAVRRALDESIAFIYAMELGKDRDIELAKWDTLNNVVPGQ
tara:strand:- start:1623 stop:3236 length:1614 start_codon:yes stop_codon:yes gene_type:complete